MKNNKTLNNSLDGAGISSNELTTIKNKFIEITDPLISLTFIVDYVTINESSTMIVGDEMFEELEEFQIYVHGKAISNPKDYDCILLFFDTSFDEVLKMKELYQRLTTWFVMGTFVSYQDEMTIFDASTSRVL